MLAYTLTLFCHLICVLLATGAMAANFQSALRLRGAESAEAALGALASIGKVVPVFPVAVLGLLVSGGAMTHMNWTWTTPWVMASLAGLVLIVVMGAGVDRARLGALKSELGASGFSDRARRLRRDPVAWSARLCNVALLVAVVLNMTLKPDLVVASAILVIALVLGVLAAVPFWRGSTKTPAA